ncbi:hypothetical protein [Paenibacillus sp. IHBB 10380]|uniref:hypothetical protein n=1 Tax=Paenibacillus sp. IHBB 10380 TaxID=1566358 RepID=UPI0005CF974D|nr:hypothetical protein [Paenibacillus sp. IHBB 10380]AJS60221.1 hypothetical protein UB51_19145 [Paenibacillus sp. IHBB 10380]
MGRAATKEALKPDKDKSCEAIEWLKKYYPESYVLLNHLSRHNGSNSGVVTIEDLRKLNDMVPDIVHLTLYFKYEIILSSFIL